jgi:hypothetical protein
MATQGPPPRPTCSRALLFRQDLPNVRVPEGNPTQSPKLGWRRSHTRISHIRRIARVATCRDSATISTFCQEHEFRR